MVGYVELTEADNYISTHYLSTDNVRVSWEALNNTDKQVHLTAAVDAINRLIIPGKKTYPNSDNIFPRWPNTEVPKAVKYAQIEIAASRCDAQVSADAEMYQKMRAFGVTSYRIGNLSETLANASGGAYLAQSGIISTKAQALLQPWTGGAFTIE